MSDWRKQQGERLKAVRKSLKLRQKDMADGLGIGVSGYSEIENGRNKISNEIGIRLLEQFNVNLNYILGGKGSMFLTDVDEKTEDVNIHDLAKTVKEIKQELGEIKKGLQ